MSGGKLEVNNLRYTYPDGHPAIKGLSFHVTPGESVAIIGGNGAGKTTLLLLMMGLLWPSSGEIVVDGIAVTKKTLPQIRQRMGMVFQDPDDQLFMTTVYDDVAFGPRNSKLDEQAVEKRVEAALAAVGIAHLKDRAPFKLSGGEKRAAAIASVLSMGPDILVMDEPTSALDPKSRRRFMELLRSFPHTKIITSHDLDMVLENCDRTIVIQQGEIIADGPTKTILLDAELMELSGLEQPLTVQACPNCGGLGRVSGSDGKD
ncbi:ATP-binding cassette domain-containing protein [Heliobacterium gestii]|uniref:ATP-binding cassette domain-containing protein n=1 Tax=Heliomicrobium gestii TaxID=2699 RepID=A0A845LB51_HELGE|nr:ABC transporter ATP-binding protein [Heliomicrobium gestii]MBM7867613.1 cobalt/nickel transport system ATP-binding protein [Heliomicrobium gestii]MZP44007.1 ATP-binding cassette domain-containing protein [Heliomicrobium gestii]